MKNNVIILSKDVFENYINYHLSNGEKVNVERLNDEDGEVYWDFDGSMNTYPTAEDAIDDYINTYPTAEVDIDDYLNC